MVFSLFSRKERGDARKPREAAAARDPESRAGAVGSRGSANANLAAQREAARRTELKIDQIESEMIAAEAVARAGQSALPTKPAAAAAAHCAAPRSAVVPEVATSLLLGDPEGAMAIDVTGPALPGVLEEAAILYSNGQAQPAALVLRQALDDPELGVHQTLAWLMLLDLYQCIGDRSAFDALALRYASHFEASPPGWSDALAPDRSGARSGGSASARRGDAAAASSSAGVLAMPQNIDASLAERASRFADAQHSAAAKPDAAIDFTDAGAIDAAGAAALLALLARFERSKAPLEIRNAERLFSLARSAIEPGRRDSSDAVWMLALQALRILGRQQDFDDLGIEYCVTYEVSPPSWEPVAATIRATSGDETRERDAGDLPGAEKEAKDSAAGAAHAGLADASADDPLPNAGAAFALSGEVLGRMQSERQALRAFAAQRGDVVIDCRSLRRMEFVAAGDLLNEIATMRSAGRQVLFVEPNYLVYALMLVMGIHDLAEIRRRKV